MKKLQNVFKIISLLAFVLTLAPGCIPNTTIGNPTPVQGGEFNVGLNYIYPITTTPQYKVILVDDDSLLFAIFKETYAYISIGAKSATANQYEFYAGTHTSPNALNTLPAGVNISATPDVGHTWQPFTQQIWFSTTYDKELIFSEEGSVDFATVWKDIPDMNRYIVFRRLKGTTYQYYWVKTGAIFTGVPLYPDYQMTASTHLFNGKYQMNSIITGQ